VRDYAIELLVSYSISFGVVSDIYIG
jgi:hypothetical protein